MSADSKNLDSFVTLSGQSEALLKQKALVKNKKKLQTVTIQDIQSLAYMYFNQGNFESALLHLRNAAELEPQNTQILWNIVNTLFLMRGFDEALRIAKQAITIDPFYPEAHDCLARIYGHLKNSHEALYHGEKALLAKNADSERKDATVIIIPQSRRPDFDGNEKSKNIISYSIWGNSSRYMDPLLENARRKNYFYPDWTIRVYYEEGMNPNFLADLKHYGCQLRSQPSQKLLYEGLFWRFQVINDPTVSFFQIRDADDLFTLKDQAAVNEWVNSNKYFHIMRDWFEQTDLINAGLWGGVSNVLPKLSLLLKGFSMSGPPSRMVDQQFLNKMVWPTIKQSVLIHDSIYSVFNAKPFPDYLKQASDTQLGRYRSGK